MSNFVLCQDCLRVLPFTEDRHGGLEFCKCGGDLCGCPGCMDTARQLQNGELEAKKLSVQGDDLKGWTPDDGELKPFKEVVERADITKELDTIIDQLRQQAAEQAAHIARLREAIAPLSDYFHDGVHPDGGDIQFASDVQDETPTQSMQAHSRKIEAEVIEECKGMYERCNCISHVWEGLCHMPTMYPDK